jgi:DNA/RNA-binding domain of Phe-tRNA-synthetase-like protein
MSQAGISYSISPQVFEKFPGYVRGVVVARGVTNGESPPELVSRLREAEAALGRQLNADTLAQHPRIAAWREAYRAFGAKPAKFRPSMEAMARRVLKNQAIPSINTLVDIGNTVSLRHLVPAGGHALTPINGDIELRPATGEEHFTAFGEESVENPIPGEIIFVEGNTVLTRRWTWRQAEHSIMSPDSTEIEFNVDGLPPVPISEVEEACTEIIELIREFCGGTSLYEILSQENPVMQIR